MKIEENSFSYIRKQKSIEDEKKLDGIYVVRTSTSKEQMNSNEVISAYKSLSQVERAFRSCKTVDLKLRPVFHYATDRVKSHVFICMLSYYVEWHMRKLLAPVLFDDHDRANRTNVSPVQSAKVSKSAKRKADTKRTEDEFVVHSFQGILSYLKTITRNYIVPQVEGCPTFEKLSELSALHKKIFDLLGIVV